MWGKSELEDFGDLLTGKKTRVCEERKTEVEGMFWLLICVLFFQHQEIVPTSLGKDIK